MRSNIPHTDDVSNIVITISTEITEVRIPRQKLGYSHSVQTASNTIARIPRLPDMCVAFRWQAKRGIDGAYKVLTIQVQIVAGEKIVSRDIMGEGNRVKVIGFLYSVAAGTSRCWGCDDSRRSSRCCGVDGIRGWRGVAIARSSVAARSQEREVTRQCWIIAKGASHLKGLHTKPTVRACLGGVEVRLS